VERGQEKNTMEKLRFPCRTCEQSFWNERDLKAHSTIHQTAGVKLECPICCRKIAEQCGMKLHLKFKHLQLLENKNPCLICAVKFAGGEWLLEHMNDHHKKDVERLAMATGVDMTPDPLRGIRDAVKILLDQHLKY
jgi:hypothetical protein